MRRPALLLVVSVSAVLGASAACSSSSSSTPAGTSDALPVVINDKAQLLAPTAVGDVTVASDHLTFPQATHADILQHQPGDILVGGPNKGSKTNPLGFIRKVTSITSDGTTITVATTQALLNEVLRQGKIQGTLQSPALGLTGPQAMDYRGGGLRPEGNPMPLSLLDFSGQDIFSGSGSVNLLENPPKSIGFSAHATFTKGTLTFTPSFDVGADIQLDLSNILGSIQDLHVIATGELDADVEIDAALSLTGNATGDDLAQLIAQKVFQAQSKTLCDYPIDLGSLTVGPLTIPASAEFKTTLNCTFDWGGNAEVTGGATASEMVQAGFKYDPTNGFQPVLSHSETFMQVGPTWTLQGEVGAKCTLQPEFDLKFWDVATGDIWADPYVAFQANAQCDASNPPKLTGQVSGDAYAGISAAAKAQVDIFGLYNWEKECTLFSYETPHASFSGSFPLPGGSMATCTPPAAQPPAANQPSPPAMCFGNGQAPPPSSGADAGLNPVSDDDGGQGTTEGGSTGDGAPGACNPNDDPPPDGWTCDASKYGDCTCDCGCGATDIDCAAGQCGACDHNSCTVGDALGTSCTQDGQNGACIQSICANDSYCCDFEWSASCVAHVTNGDYACTAMACP